MNQKNFFFFEKASNLVCLFFYQERKITNINCYLHLQVWNLIPKAAGKKRSDTRRGGSKGWAWDIAMYIFVLAVSVIYLYTCMSSIL